MRLLLPQTFSLNRIPYKFKIVFKLLSVKNSESLELGTVQYFDILKVGRVLRAEVHLANVFKTLKEGSRWGMWKKMK